MPPMILASLWRHNTALRHTARRDSDTRRTGRRPGSPCRGLYAAYVYAYSVRPTETKP